MFWSSGIDRGDSIEIRVRDTVGRFVGRDLFFTFFYVWSVDFVLGVMDILV